MIDFTAARGIADAVFYEGFLLYPYTATSHKNKLRWQFGVVVPKAHEAAGTGEYAHQRTEVLCACPAGARIDVLVRFLHVEARTVEELRGQTYVAVAALTAGDAVHYTFDESIERSVRASFTPAQERARITFAFDGGRRTEELRDSHGALCGRIRREHWPLSGLLSIEATRVAKGEVPVWRLCVRLENASAVVAAPERGVVVRTAFVSTHTLLGISDGAFWSPIDPPDAALAATVPLVNDRTWPVLIGDCRVDEQRARIVLSSPIVLADFPQIAQNTNADAFDGTEIDELLSLSVLSLSDAERAEARATDPRARAIVARAEAFGERDVARTHATFTRDDDADDVPTFGSPGSLETSAAPTSVCIDGVVVAKGSSVRLAPKRRADAWDMFLAGKIATVQAIHMDLEDRTYVAVTVDDDPATEYHQWYGRSFFFEPDEVEPLGVSA